jgi:hypothetical protein
MVLHRFVPALLLRESTFVEVRVRLWIGGTPCNLTPLVRLELA